MELPHDSNGDLDWNTLGNLLTAHILGEVLHARFVDYKYGMIGRDMHPVDTSWQFSYEQDDVIVLKKVHPNSPLHAFMGRGIIELPMEDVVLFIKNVAHREQWDKHLLDIAVVCEFSSTDFLVHMHHRARKCLIRAERDWLYYERACYVDDKFVMTALSVDHPDYPPQRGLTRAQLLPGTGWVLEPYDGSHSTTLVSYIAHLDLKALPPIIVNRTLQRQVMAVRFIHDILTPPSPSSPSPSPLHHHHEQHTSQPSRHRRGVGDNGSHKETFPRGQGVEGGNESEVWSGRSGNGTDNSRVPFEDPVSVYAFTRSNLDMKRMESVPWDVDHRWNGDGHNHTHLEAREVSANTERLRSYSEGESASPHSIPVAQPPLQTVEDVEDIG